jgi:HTH-type transcriptional regulator / antitoxin MqsA
MVQPHDDRTCPICGRGVLRTVDTPIEEQEGGQTYLVREIVRDCCNACGEEFFTAGQVDEIARIVVSAARADLGRLSSDEIHQLRHDLGLTQAELESQLGVGAGTVGRWERGTVLQGATADRLMRVLWAHPELLPELGYVAREGRGPYRKRG